MSLKALSRLLAAAAAVLQLAPVAGADIIWSDDFTGQVNGTFPNRDFTGAGGNDWTMQAGDSNMIQVSTAVGEPGPSLTFTDASTSSNGAIGSAVPRLQMSQFAPFITSAATPLLRLTFDWQVESFISDATNLSFRVILRANGSLAAGDQMVVAFNRGSLDDGDGLGNDLAFTAGSPGGTSNLDTTDGSAIGLIPGVGWLPGFDFGQYSATAADNDSDDLFYRFQLTYDFNTGGLDGLVTRLAQDASNGQSATFTRSMNSGLVFSNSESDVILLASTNGTTGVSRFDNFQVEIIPEPSAIGALLIGGLCLVSRRFRQVE